MLGLDHDSYKFDDLLLLEVAGKTLQVRFVDGRSGSLTFAHGSVSEFAADLSLSLRANQP